MRIWIQIGLLFALTAVAAAQPRAVAGGDTRYVDARVCATCHRQIAEDYARTGMGRSFFRPAPANTLEAYSTDPIDIYHAASETHYAMIRRGAEHFQRRWQIGFDGKEANVEELRIDYVMGSGNHARSYLHRTARGTLIELPLGWYAELKATGLGVSGRGYWGMSPGSDNDRPRTRRFVSYKCMFCHNGIPQIPPGHEAPGSDPVFAGDLPEGIDCQRCHGPGGRHIRALQTRAAKPEDIRASIVNPARLTPKLRMEICMQCHLQTSSGRIPSSIMRFNRGPFSFVPGEPLQVFMLAFDHAPGTGHDGKFEAVSSVYRLRQSRCFERSEGRLTCDTCHNPHRLPRGNEAVAHYARVCRQCHAIDSAITAGRHTASSECARCHMPKRRAEDTPGMIMTDHLIQRRPPAGDLIAEFRERPVEEYRGQVVPYYPSPLPQTAENALYQAVAQVGLGNNVEAGLPVLARELARQKPVEAQFYHVLGEGWQSAGKLREAVAAFERAVQLNPKSPAGLRALASAFSVDGQVARAAEALSRAVKIAPSEPLTWHRYGLLDLLAGRVPDAVQKIRRAIALDPSLPDQARNLAEALIQSGQPDAARAALREALRADPYDDAAWNLGGRMLAGRGEMAEAFYHFERAIRLRPAAPYLYDFALALVRVDRFEEAQARAEAAARSDPNFADAQELMGGLFARRQQWPEAERAYRRTIELRPDSSRARLHLGNVLAARGDLTGAAEQLREAAKSSDPDIAQQALRALRQIGAR